MSECVEDPVRVAVVGSRGFVGSAVAEVLGPSRLIEVVRGSRVGDARRVICAAPSGSKFQANRFPDKDRRDVQAVLDTLLTSRRDVRVVQVSSIDVEAFPDEPYASNRAWLERQVASAFPDHLIVRLPAIFGKGLKKNPYYDLLHGLRLDKMHEDSIHYAARIEDIAMYLCRIASEGLRGAVLYRGGPLRLGDAMRVLGYHGSNEGARVDYVAALPEESIHHVQTQTRAEVLSRFKEFALTSNRIYSSRRYENRFPLYRQTLAGMPDDVPLATPEKIEIHLGPVCNLRCQWCYGDDLKAAGRRPLGSDVVLDLLSAASTWQPKPLIIYAGLNTEPTLHESWATIVRHTSERGCRFGLYSHGLNLRHEGIAALTSPRRLESYVSLNVSAAIAAGKETLLLAAVETLVKARDTARSSLVINCPIVLPPFHPRFATATVLWIIETLLDLRVDNVRLSFAWDKLQPALRGRLEYSADTSDNTETVRQAREQFGDRIHYRPTTQSAPLFRRCSVAMIGCSISHTGRVYPCPETSAESFDTTHCLGSLNEQPFSEIWGGARHREVLRYLASAARSCTCVFANASFNSACAGASDPKPAAEPDLRFTA